MNSVRSSESGKKTAASFLKGMGRRQWTVALLLGILLMVIAVPTSRQNTEKKEGTAGISEIQNGQDRTELESRLETILEATEGVGRVRVMLMTDSGQNLYGTDGTEVTGALIVAEGADDSVTVQKIQQAVMALFQIEAHKIKIMKMK